MAMHACDLLPFEQHLASIIHNHQLLEQQERVVVGVSGGADSIALLLALHTLGHHPLAVHVNFTLRGEESVRDEQFVRALCARHGIPLEVFVHDTRAEAAGCGESIEMAARRIRYARFEEVQQRYAITHTAVAHHKSDNAETLLLNLIRGSGMRGLCGMRYKQGAIIRPCLDCEKSTLLDYLNSRQESYVTDSSNAIADVKRNKLRLEVLPLLQELNPSINDTLHATAHRLSEALTIYEVGLQQLGASIITHYAPSTIHTHPRLVINRTALNHCSVAATLLYECLSPYGFTAQQIADLLAQKQGQAGASYFTEQWELHRERTQLALYPRVSLDFEPITLQEGHQNIEGLGVVCVERIPREILPTLHTEAHVALIDANRVSGLLQMRRIVAGERFCPLGMKKSQLISDHLTNRRLSLREKQVQTAIYDDKGIVWLTGVRISDRYKIEPNTTEVIRLTLVQPVLKTC